jgi:hypothetical protein
MRDRTTLLLVLVVTALLTILVPVPSTPRCDPASENRAFAAELTPTASRGRCQRRRIGFDYSPGRKPETTELMGKYEIPMAEIGGSPRIKAEAMA